VTNKSQFVSNLWESQISLHPSSQASDPSHPPLIPAIPPSKAKCCAAKLYAWGRAGETGSWVQSCPALFLSQSLLLLTYDAAHIFFLSSVPPHYHVSVGYPESLVYHLTSPTPHTLDYQCHPLSKLRYFHRYG